MRASALLFLSVITCTFKILDSFCLQAAGLDNSTNSSSDASTIFAFTDKALDAVLYAVNQPLDALLQDTKFMWQVRKCYYLLGGAVCRTCTFCLCDPVGDGAAHRARARPAR